MSGTMSAMPSSAATRWAPAFWVKLSSVQVSPDRNQNTGTLPRRAAGGQKAAKRIAVPVASESCL